MSGTPRSLSDPDCAAPVGNSAYVSVASSNTLNVSGGGLFLLGGGGLARVDGRLRLVEGLAMPRDEDEFALSCYNTLTCWIDLDRLLA